MALGTITENRKRSSLTFVGRNGVTVITDRGCSCVITCYHHDTSGSWRKIEDKMASRVIVQWYRKNADPFLRRHSPECANRSATYSYCGQREIQQFCKLNVGTFKRVAPRMVETPKTRPLPADGPRPRENLLPTPEMVNSCNFWSGRTFFQTVRSDVTVDPPAQIAAAPSSKPAAVVSTSKSGKSSKKQSAKQVQKIATKEVKKQPQQKPQQQPKKKASKSKSSRSPAAAPSHQPPSPMLKESPELLDPASIPSMPARNRRTKTKIPKSHLNPIPPVASLI